MCKEKGITINQFAEYYNNNPKHYKFNLMIIEKSSKGFWVSVDTKISDEFINKYYNEIMQRLRKIANKLTFIWKCNTYNEDLIDETMILLYLRCGNIVQNFYFDINVLFNILMCKAKYFMFNIYRKKYKSKNTISYHSFNKETNLDHIDLFKDNRYDPQILLDS